jgi:hypothetical protein
MLRQRSLELQQQHRLRDVSAEVPGFTTTHEEEVNKTIPESTAPEKGQLFSPRHHRHKHRGGGARRKKPSFSAAPASARRIIIAEKEEQDKGVLYEEEEPLAFEAALPDDRRISSAS